MPAVARILLMLAPIVLGMSLRGRIRSAPIHLAVTDFFFPALVLDLLLADPPGLGDLAFSGAGLVFHVVAMTPLGLLAARLLRRSRGEILLPVAFMNSGFLGIPATLLLAGSAAARHAVLFDQAMTLAIYTYGLAMVLPGGVGRGVKEILRAPAFWAFLLAMGLGAADWRPGGAVLLPLSWIGKLTVPCALFAVGLDLEGKREDLLAAFPAAGLRLAGGTLVGIASILLARRIGGARADPEYIRMLWIEGMMPSAVFSAVLPARYGAGGTIASTIVLVSTLLFPLWFLLIAAFAPWAFLS